MTDAMGGQIQMVFGDLASAVPQVKAGKLRALAVTSTREHPMLAGIPPMAKVVPNFELTALVRHVCTRGHGDAQLARMNQLMRTAMADTGVRQKLIAAGYEITPSSPAELGLFAAKETLKWAKAVQAAGIIPE